MDMGVPCRQEGMCRHRCTQVCYTNSAMHPRRSGGPLTQGSCRMQSSQCWRMYPCRLKENCGTIKKKMEQEERAPISYGPLNGNMQAGRGKEGCYLQGCPAADSRCAGCAVSEASSSSDHATVWK